MKPYMRSLISSMRCSAYVHHYDTNYTFSRRLDAWSGYTYIYIYKDNLINKIILRINVWSYWPCMKCINSNMYKRDHGTSIFCPRIVKNTLARSRFWCNKSETFLSWRTHMRRYFFLSAYVSVNLCNQAIRELTENFRQFVKCLFQSVNLFF